MKPPDRKPGMSRAISRRDFIHDLSLVSLALSLPTASWSSAKSTKRSDAYYPPIQTGLRGSQPGSFEVAHALARAPKAFDQPGELNEDYDLIVVGGGLSGLSAAWFYRQLRGADARILVLDNHDDFGGHARRNEFHQGGGLRLAWGGTVNMEYTKYSAVARGLLDQLGIDIPRLLKDSSYGWLANSSGLQPATWFDADSFGQDALVVGVVPRDMAPQDLAVRVGEFPIPENARAALRRFLLHKGDVLADRDNEGKRAYLRSTSYADFLRQHFAMPEEAVRVFSAAPMSFWGVRAENLSVAECLETGLPGAHVLGDFKLTPEETASGPSPEAMFPDGNASIARLLVRSLIPATVPGMVPDDDPFNIVTAALDYAQLDQPAWPVRIRLNATAVHVANRADGPGVAVAYVENGDVLAVRGQHCVLACNNRIIPSLCPQLPKEQKAALEQCLRRPLLVINVALRNARAIRESGVLGAYLPGRLCQGANLVSGVNAPGYRPGGQPGDPCVVQFYGAVGAEQPEGLSISQQNRAGRVRLLAMQFEDFEREVRTVLTGIWGSSGLDPAEDILAITVNRWPHGYARDHLDLEDAAWNAQPPPNEIGRQPFGGIAIANSDAAADAYTHAAFDQAWRAVNELVTTHAG